MYMKIQTVQLEKMRKGAFSSGDADGICHVKTLSCLSIVQAAEGRYEIAIKDGPLLDTGNGGFFVAPSDVKQTIVHHADPHSGRFTGRWIFLWVKVNEAFRLDTVLDLPVTLPPSEVTAMNAVFDRLFSAESVFLEYQCVYEILSILTRNSTERSMVKMTAMQPVLTYIHEHYREKVTVEDLAALSALSVSRLFAVFKETTGYSPIAYLNNYRLSLAAERLIHTSDTVTRIACEVGIEDAVYFNKLFRKTYHTSPSAYRQSYKET